MADVAVVEEETTDMLFGSGSTPTLVGRGAKGAAAAMSLSPPRPGRPGSSGRARSAGADHRGRGEERQRDRHAVVALALQPPHPAAAATEGGTPLPLAAQPTARERALARAYAIARASVAATASTLSTLPIGPDEELPAEQDELDEENAHRLRALVRRSSRAVHRRLVLGFFAGVMLVGGSVTAFVCVPAYLRYVALGSSGVLALTVGSLLAQWHLGAVLLWTVLGEPAVFMDMAEALLAEYLRQLRCWRTMHNAGGALDVHWALSARTQLRTALQAVCVSPPFAMLCVTVFALLWVHTAGAMLLFLNPSPPARYNWGWLVALLVGTGAIAAGLQPFWSLAHLASSGTLRTLREMRADTALALMEDSPEALIRQPIKALAATGATTGGAGNATVVISAAPGSYHAGSSALLPAVGASARRPMGSCCEASCAVHPSFSPRFHLPTRMCTFACACADLRRHLSQVEAFETYLAVNDMTLRIFGLRITRPAVAAVTCALVFAFALLLRDSLLASGALHTWA